MRRFLLLVTIALLLAPLLAAPAAGQDGPSIMDVLLDLEVVEIVDVDSGDVQSVSGDDPPAPLIQVLGEGRAMIPLGDLDRNGDGVISPSDFLGDAVAAPVGESITIGSPDRPDLPHGAVILPQDFAFWEFSDWLVWNVVQLSAPLDGPVGETEVGFYEVRSGLPLIESVPDVNLPGVGFTTGTGLVDTADGVFETAQIQTVDSGVPTRYASPYIAATWTTNGEHFAALGTENPLSEFTAIVSNGIDPLDPATFWWQPTPLRSEPTEVTIEDLQAAIDELAARMAAGAADPSGSDQQPPTVVGDNAPIDSEDDGDDSSGLPAWLLGIIGVTVLAAVTAAVKFGPLANKDDGPPEKPSATVKGAFAGTPLPEHMGDPAHFLLRDAEDRGLPLIDGKQKVDSGRVGQFSTGEPDIYRERKPTLYQAESLFEEDSIGISNTLALEPPPQSWQDATPLERVQKFGYWVDTETMTVSIGGVDHPDLPDEPPTRSPETDGPGPVGMGGDVVPS
ncbi:MAG: hypothetical protein DHS20C19_26170 [Acidimicrobiales bacterium]|nr:MAG: hypothetical protein DHS20C19_26170 [Acidimicrobiales bacterium]